MSNHSAPAFVHPAERPPELRGHQELTYPTDHTRVPFEVPGFTNQSGSTKKQKTEPATFVTMSIDKDRGAATHHVVFPTGWNAPMGSFNDDLELFVLEGELHIGGHKLGKYSYSYIPAGIIAGPWSSPTECTLLWMPFGYLKYQLEEPDSLCIEGSSTTDPMCASTYHSKTLLHPRFQEYIPAKDTASQPWETTRFLPPGACRKSLRGSVDGPATWILGLVPQWIEGNFKASHPTSEEAYLLEGDIGGHWAMHDNPFQCEFAVCKKDGYYWRPAHVPHGPFYTDSGCLLLFRTERKLKCDFTLHQPDYTQHEFNKKIQFTGGKTTFHGSSD